MKHDIKRNDMTDQMFRSIPCHVMVGFLPLLSSLSGITPRQSQTDPSKNHHGRKQKAQ